LITFPIAFLSLFGFTLKLMPAFFTVVRTSSSGFAEIYLRALSLFSHVLLLAFSQSLWLVALQILQCFRN